MRKISLVALFVFCFAQVNAFGICTSPSGPYCLFPGCYYVYTQDRSCYNQGSGNVTNSTDNCVLDDAWTFGYGWSYRQTTFTLTSSEPLENPNNWEIASWVNFNSPGASSSDGFEIDVSVQHPNNTTDSYTLVHWSGPNGNLSSCPNGPFIGYFAANTGDTVTIAVFAWNYGGATIQISDPRLFNLQ